MFTKTFRFPHKRNFRALFELFENDRQENKKFQSKADSPIFKNLLGHPLFFLWFSQIFAF